MGSNSVLVVATDSQRKALATRIQKAGYATRFSELPDAMTEWDPLKAPGFLVVDVGIPSTDVEKLCRHVKLHETFNRISVVVIREESPHPPPGEHLRVEPDRYIQDGATHKDFRRVLRERRRVTAEREKAGVRFHLETLTPSDLTVLSEVAEILEPVLWHSGFPENTSQRVRYGVLEMGLNAMEWGNSLDSDRWVRFVFTIYGDRFTAKIADEGPGFDTDAVEPMGNVPDPRIRKREREEVGKRFGGYGVSICRKFMDEVEYNEAGNEVLLTKYLPGASG